MKKAQTSKPNEVTNKAKNQDFHSQKFKLSIKIKLCFSKSKISFQNGKLGD